VVVARTRRRGGGFLVPVKKAINAPATRRREARVRERRGFGILSPMAFRQEERREGA
jgi:hypothetical protein